MSFIEVLITEVQDLERLKMGYSDYMLWPYSSSIVIATLEKEISTRERNISNMKLQIESPT